MSPLIAAANTTTTGFNIISTGANNANSSNFHTKKDRPLAVATPPHAVWLSACLTHGLAGSSHWTVAKIGEM
jgi:hypothetical protein